MIYDLKRKKTKKLATTFIAARHLALENIQYLPSQLTLLWHFVVFNL